MSLLTNCLTHTTKIMVSVYFDYIWTASASL